MNHSLFIRRSEALTLTGLSDEEFSKAVHAETIEAVYLVWQVRDARGTIVQETNEAKAKSEAERLGGRAEPLGRAYYRREQILKLTTATPS
jgi:hypothetical protein